MTTLRTVAAEGILSGITGSWHTTNAVPWDAGISVGVFDMDFTS